jgi:putative transposase
MRLARRAFIAALSPKNLNETNTDAPDSVYQRRPIRTASVKSRLLNAPKLGLSPKNWQVDWPGAGPGRAGLHYLLRINSRLVSGRCRPGLPGPARVVNLARALRKHVLVVSRPKRLANRSYVGRFQYFLTFCAWKRRPVFEDAIEVADALAHIQRTAGEESFAILAYCFMPDHVHLLVKGIDQKSDLRRFVKFSKARSGRAYRKRIGERLWQEGYYDRVLRDESESRRYAEYIVSNPVRAGLAADEMNAGPGRPGYTATKRFRTV